MTFFTLPTRLLQISYSRPRSHHVKIQQITPKNCASEVNGAPQGIPSTSTAKIFKFGIEAQITHFIVMVIAILNRDLC
jgi:hypothetical protein